MLRLHTRLLLLLVFVLSGTNSSGQYLSTLNDGQSWALSGYDIVYGEERYMAEIYVDGEETYEGQEYKLLRITSPLSSQHPFGLIREDTVAGKVWFRSHLHGDFDEYMDTSPEVLIADYSLEVGDQFYYTFFLGYDWLYDSAGYFIDSLLFEVEEVGVVNGRKYIQTNSLTVLDEEQNWLLGNPFYYSSLQFSVANQVPLRFIEGIGPSYSLIWQNFAGISDQRPFDPYLLCAYIDDVEIWNDPFVDGCYYEGGLPLITSIENHDYDFDFVAFPNPASSHIRLQLPPEFAARVVVTVYNIAGQVVSHHDNFNTQHPLPMPHPPGLYVVEARSDGNVAREKVVVE